MSNTIQIKYHNTSGTPTPTLTHGELAIDSHAGRLWYSDNSENEHYISLSSLNNDALSSTNLAAMGNLSGTNTGDQTTIPITNTTTDATHYITFVDSDSGSENIRTDSGTSGLRYNPSSNTLWVDKIVTESIWGAGEQYDLENGTADIQGWTTAGVNVANAGIYVKNGATSSGFMRFYEDSDAGSNYLKIQAPGTLADDNTLFQFPSDNGTSGYVLKTDGNGVTSWLNTGTLGPSLTPATGAIASTNAAVIPGVVPAGSQGVENKILHSNMTYQAAPSVSLGSGSAVLTYSSYGNADTTITFDGAANQGISVSASGTTANFALDIDGMTDIGAALADADLFIVDDGANGTNKKATMSRLATYMESAISPSTITVTDSTANTNFPVVFHNESNGLLDDTGALRYNPSTGTL